MAVLPRVLFRESDGRRKGFIFSFLSFISLLGWAYFGVLLNGSHFSLFLGIPIAFIGVAESLPKDRQRIAGVLRVLALGTGVIYLVGLALAPELALN